MGNIAPYSVTIGGYGLMFHTYFAETEGKAKIIKEISIRKIDEIFSHNKIALSERDGAWHEKYRSLMMELSEENGGES